MNNKLKKFGKSLTGKNGVKNLVISIVILVELIAILGVATYAWVETVSSIKITTESTKELEVDTYVFTEATIGGSQGTIDMGKYFKQSGDMHFAPASSADGVNMFFPKLTSNGTAYVSSGSSRFRKGNTGDMNTAYMSVTFKLKASTNADFFFYFNGNNNPTFSSQASNMRVSVTAYPEGTSKGDLYDNTGKPKYTKVYANSASTTPVVGSIGGTTSATTVEAFADHIKGTGTTNRLFAVGANETKIVTIKVWLQGTTIDSNLPQDISISNFGIISDLTPRHVTLIPTPTWEGNSPTYYAWCWDATNGDPSKLFKLDLDADEHYSFDYNGTYQKTTFVRAVPGCTVSAVDENGNNGKAYSSWPFSNNSASNTDGYWNQTVNTTIPKDPVDPTYIIETISGGSDGKSTGMWLAPSAQGMTDYANVPGVATIKIATVADQSSWGTVSATSYRTASVSTNDVIESTNSTSQKHKDTVHAWPGKAIQLTATAANTNYSFVGWYNNAEGTGTALSTSATYTTTAPSTASEITYYAKFVETRKLTIYRYLDGSNVSTSCGTITIAGTNSTSGTTATKTVNKGTSVSFSAAAATGYTLEGIFTTSTGSNTASSPVTLNSNTSYYARFTTNTHTVNLNTIGSTGSTVQYGNETASTSVTKTGVKYNSSVTIKANPAAGYEFVGWYTNSSGTGTAESTDASYSFTLGDADVTYYAKFKAVNIYLTGWINGAAVTSGQTALKFSSSGNANEYTLNYTFTGNQGGYQYVTIYDGTNVYHPATHESGSGVAADLTKTDTGPNNDPKWKVNATSHDVATFTWNNSTKTLSWSITKYYYFDCGNCSWFKNDGCVPAVSYNYGAYQAATLVSGNLYCVAIPEDVTTFSLSRHNSSGDYNAFNITKSGTNNRYNINSNCNGGSWTTY